MKRPIIFIGSAAFGLRSLAASPFFDVRGAMCLKDRFTESLAAVAAELGTDIDLFGNKREFRALVERQPRSMPFFIYQLDMIVPADLTQIYAFYNVHRGNLMTNRGARPDVWAILEGHTSTALSLHRIDGQIDAGTFIASCDEPIAATDDPGSVRARLEQHLPDLIDALDAFLNGRIPGKPLHGGIYRPFVTESDFTIDLERDSLEVIDRKIRSQRPYNGAILQASGSKHYVVAIQEAALRSGDQWYFTLDAATVRTRSVTHDLVFSLNTEPIFPSPPVVSAIRRT